MTGMAAVCTTLPMRRRAQRPGAGSRPDAIRLEAAVIAAMPRSLGRDLLETLHGGWLDEPLWEAYGDLGDALDVSRIDTSGAEQHSDPARAAEPAHDHPIQDGSSPVTEIRTPEIDPNTERRLYVDVAALALTAMCIAGACSRSGTEYRIASTVIAELHGDLTRNCGRCYGSGRSSGRAGGPCRVCKGKGVLPPSLSTRADECQCRRPEFRDRLFGVYLTVLSRLRRELDAATDDYGRARDGLPPVARQWRENMRAIDGLTAAGVRGARLA
jgi:hypothetical protein